MKKIWKKTVSFIIVLSILFTSQGIDVLAKEKLDKRESVNLHGKLKYDKIYKNLTKNVKNINVDTCKTEVNYASKVQEDECASTKNWPTKWYCYKYSKVAYTLKSKKKAIKKVTVNGKKISSKKDKAVVKMANNKKNKKYTIVVTLKNKKKKIITVYHDFTNPTIKGVKSGSTINLNNGTKKVTFKDNIRLKSISICVDGKKTVVKNKKSYTFVVSKAGIYGFTASDYNGNTKTISSVYVTEREETFKSDFLTKVVVSNASIVASPIPTVVPTITPTNTETTVKDTIVSKKEEVGVLIKKSLNFNIFSDMYYDSAVCNGRTTVRNGRNVAPPMIFSKINLTKELPPTNYIKYIMNAYYEKNTNYYVEIQKDMYIWMSDNNKTLNISFQGDYLIAPKQIYFPWILNGDFTIDWLDTSNSEVVSLRFVKNSNVVLGEKFKTNNFNVLGLGVYENDGSFTGKSLLNSIDLGPSFIIPEKLINEVACLRNWAKTVYARCDVVEAFNSDYRKKLAAAKDDFETEELFDNIQTANAIIPKKYDNCDGNNVETTSFINTAAYLKGNGMELNLAMKKISGSNVGLDEKDTKIKCVKYSETAPADGTIAYDLSDSGSVPIYVWFNKDTLYFYTNASWIFLPTDSSYLFSGIQFSSTNKAKTKEPEKASDFLFHFRADNVTNMSHMFQYVTEYQIRFRASFNTNKVKDMSFMFRGVREIAYDELRKIYDIKHEFQDKSEYKGYCSEDIKIKKWNKTYLLDNDLDLGYLCTENVEKFAGMFYDRGDVIDITESWVGIYGVVVDEIKYLGGNVQIGTNFTVKNCKDVYYEIITETNCKDCLLVEDRWNGNYYASQKKFVIVHNTLFEEFKLPHIVTYSCGWDSCKRFGGCNVYCDPDHSSYKLNWISCEGYDCNAFGSSDGSTREIYQAKALGYDLYPHYNWCC
ncbi:MAG: BspA family leucine-rich repeat surface protein [Lachnospiraceae bacterium]|nr:BspA family leucine-rich repeat surface protein [Lachnospiraceae bacterium]